MKVAISINITSLHQIIQKWILSLGFWSDLNIWSDCHLWIETRWIFLNGLWADGGTWEDTQILYD